MKQLLPYLLVLACISAGSVNAQKLKIRKGIIVDSLKLNDSIPESFALYLPISYDNSKKWPIIYVFDLKGRAKQTLRLFKASAEKQQYILAASNNLSDSLSLSQNILIYSRMFDTVSSLFPINNDRIYTAGFSGGARVATLAPTFIKQIDGVISLSSAVPNTEILNNKNVFHYVGIVGKEDFNYVEMLAGEKTLNKIKFPNNLLVFEGGHQWPDHSFLEKAMEILTLAAMAKGNVQKDSVFINRTYKENLSKLRNLLDTKRMLIGYGLLQELIGIYRPHLNVDSLVLEGKKLKKDKLYRAQKRAENIVLFKESFIKDDFDFSLTEDVETLNYNNLGWWIYQMSELKEYENKPKLVEKQMGRRLIGYLNALIEDNIDIEIDQEVVNEEAVLFLWMLKTITDSKNYSYYLKIISATSEMEDYGTALFYLEELLKNGYDNKTALYSLDHTALLRITPEFNKVVDKYLKDARYELIEQ